MSSKSSGYHKPSVVYGTDCASSLRQLLYTLPTLPATTKTLRNTPNDRPQNGSGLRAVLMRKGIQRGPYEGVWQGILQLGMLKEC